MTETIPIRFFVLLHRGWQVLIFLDGAKQLENIQHFFKIMKLEAPATPLHDQG